MNFIKSLAAIFHQNASSALAIPMENYMKNNFPFLDIKTEKRRAILKSQWQITGRKSKAITEPLLGNYFQKKNENFIIVVLKF